MSGDIQSLVFYLEIALGIGLFSVAFFAAFTSKISVYYRGWIVLLALLCFWIFALRGNVFQSLLAQNGNYFFLWILGGAIMGVLTLFVNCKVCRLNVFAVNSLRKSTKSDGDKNSSSDMWRYIYVPFVYGTCPKCKNSRKDKNLHV